MLEAVTEAIVLDKEDLGEYDSRVFLYTKDFGKISVKAASLRKITSKLAGHLEPLKYIVARLVSGGNSDGKNFQLTDALTVRDFDRSKIDLEKMKEIFPALKYVRLSAPEGVPDQGLWNLLYSINAGETFYNAKDMLKFFGFDPIFSKCELCSKSGPEYFFSKSNFFVCNRCALNSNVSKNELILV